MKITSYFLYFFLFSQPAFAWNDHTFTTYYALKNSHQTNLKTEVKVETLEEFLIDLKTNHPNELYNTMEDVEKWTILSMPGYKPTPQNLLYAEGNLTKNTISSAFFNAIRVNPGILNKIYIRNIPKLIMEQNNFSPNLWQKSLQTDFTQIVIPSIHKDTVPGLHYYNLSTKTKKLPALIVLATAADLPDLGLDINLFENNNSDMGERYGFGQEPFGDPRFSYASQAPFHYGAYHEWGIFYTLAPQTKECYGEFRIKLFRSLAKLAFKTGHDYWGWKFLGIGLHYIQDLTQPYHTHFFPGYSTQSIIANYALSLIGFKKPLTSAINLVANQHSVLEDFVLKLLQNPTLKPSLIFQNALSLRANFNQNLTYNDSLPRNKISQDAFEHADKLALVLKNNFPKHFVKDPEFFYDDKKEDILKVFLQLNPSQQNEIVQTLIPILEQTGEVTRLYLADFIH